ncbi:MAG: hypothetical protein J3K34DRAFT_93466 [Monoraphidium minutum]|nr:MAG: hypothetical protein J3K34DRAFT_93466 [Monoraphidium minutum]
MTFTRGRHHALPPVAIGFAIHTRQAAPPSPTTPHGPRAQGAPPAQHTPIHQSFWRCAQRRAPRPRAGARPLGSHSLSAGPRLRPRRRRRAPAAAVVCPGAGAQPPPCVPLPSPMSTPLHSYRPGTGRSAARQSPAQTSSPPKGCPTPARPRSAKRLASRPSPPIHPCWRAAPPGRQTTPSLPPRAAAAAPPLPLERRARRPRAQAGRRPAAHARPAPLASMRLHPTRQRERPSTGSSPRPTPQELGRQTHHARGPTGRPRRGRRRARGAPSTRPARAPRWRPPRGRPRALHPRSLSWPLNPTSGAARTPKPGVGGPGAQRRRPRPRAWAPL